MRLNLLVGSVLLAAASSLGVISSALAAPVSTIVNIDLEGYRTAGGGTDSNVPPVTFSGVGAAGGGSTFNGIDPSTLSDNTNSPTTGDNQTLTGTGLLNSNGGGTGIGFSIGPVGVDNENTNIGGGATASQALFSDYVFNNSAGNGPGDTSNFTISHLTPLATYDVYLYFSQAPSLAITGGTLITPTLTGIYNSGNTKVYAVAADGSGNISGTLGSGTNVFNGLTVASVPEPASLCLLGLGGLGLLARRRHA